MMHQCFQKIKYFFIKAYRSNTVRSLFLGQCISLLLAGTGVTSQFLAQHLDVNIPTAQSVIVYMLLFIIYSAQQYRSFKSFWEVIKERTHIYLPLAAVDVQANYFVVKSYQYTSITSVMLIDCFTIPCVVLFTFIFLKSKYNWRHIVGVILCLGGIGILIYSDAVTNDSSKGGPNPLLGDILCLIGAILYAVSNVGQEANVKQRSYKEYLSMIGFYGMFIGIIQLSILERNELSSMKWNFNTIGLIISFSVFLFTMYSIAPHVLKMAGSAMFNLSTLTSDIYAIIIGIFVFGKKLSYLYFIAFICIVIGLIVYNVRNAKVTDKYTDQKKGIENIQDQEKEDDENRVGLIQKTDDTEDLKV